uniref:Secreted protein n=1 Tax=Nelumbo nucifera TaxID=4432 RepID=A0A822ZMU7_NELNU|nr:TPA_asm: hypothetical protein HUJ06_002929 [Nelumbo nucifera]
MAVAPAVVVILVACLRYLVSTPINKGNSSGFNGKLLIDDEMSMQLARPSLAFLSCATCSKKENHPR